MNTREQEMSGDRRYFINVKFLLRTDVLYFSGLVVELEKSPSGGFRL